MTPLITAQTILLVILAATHAWLEGLAGEHILGRAVMTLILALPAMYAINRLVGVPPE